LVLIISVPLFVAPGITLDPYNIPKFGLFVAGMSVVAGLWVFVASSGRPPRILARDLIVPVAIVAPLALSWVFSRYRDWALFGLYSRLQGLIPYLLFAALSVAIAAAFRGRSWAIAWALGLAGGVVGLGQLAGVVGFSPTGGQSEASTIGNSNFVGGFLAITLPVVLYLWLTAGADRRARYGAIALTILVGEGLVLSFSEGGQAAGLAGALALVGLHWGRRSSVRVLALAAALAIGGAVVALVAVPQLRPIGGFTATLRSHWWGSSIAVASEAPVAGRGPNAFAQEGSKHRPLEDVLSHGGFVPGFTPVPVEYQTSDDPHSVPLSFLVAAGGVGVAGLLLAWLWILRKTVSLPKESSPAIAFSAALVAYLVQSLVSIDEVPIRMAFATSLGGFLAALPAPPRTGWLQQDRLRGVLMIPASLIALLIAVGGTWWGFNFVRSDQLVRQGVAAFADDEPRKGERLIRTALGFRDEALYRAVLAEHLGLAALEEGERGQPLISKMQDLNTYLDDLPDVGAIQAFARLMNYWGEFDPGADQRALELYGKASELDPNNPLITVEKAEVLVDMGEIETALALLEPLRDDLEGAIPEFWGALAMTRLTAGDADGARAALESGRALDEYDCRTSLAAELLRVENGETRARSRGPAALNLLLRCDQGLFNMFLSRLPRGQRNLYS
jgi:hypothetical protein